MGDRCTGDCCRKFFLNASPQWFATRLANLKLEKRSEPEVEQIAEMLILIESVSEEENYYTCKNHDPISGDCRIYETRPKMCRDYPYHGQRCRYPGCQAEQFRAVLPPRFNPNFNLKVLDNTKVTDHWSGEEIG